MNQLLAITLITLNIFGFSSLSMGQITTTNVFTGGAEVDGTSNYRIQGWGPLKVACFRSE